MAGELDFSSIPTASLGAWRAFAYWPDRAGDKEVAGLEYIT